MRLFWILLGATTALTTVRSQDPSLFIPAAISLPPSGTTLQVRLQDGRPNAPFVVMVDVDGGPATVLGETLYVGFTSAIIPVAGGVLDGLGRASPSFAIPGGANLLGVPFFAQGAVVDPGAPNGGFRATNGEAFGFINSAAAVVERFDDAPAEGWTGNYDGSVPLRLQGGAVRTRTHNTIDPQGILFGSPILTPLNPFGNRSQFVFRPRDLGSSGEEELLTSVRWQVFRFNPVVSDRFDRIEIQAVHSLVMPDYTIDPFSGLPRFPNSGLDPLFASNYRPGESPVTLFDGPYAIVPSARQPDGYMPYPPLTQPFVYNGVDSLILEIKTTPTPTALGVNGHEVRLMVPSSPRPNARAVARGSSSRPIDPNTVTRATHVDNAMVDYQLEFVRVTTTALSGWRSSGRAFPDYRPPIVGASTPPGTSFAVEYRGADDTSGSNATAWSSSTDVADGRPFLQMRVTLVGDRASGSVPSVDTIVVPVN